MAKLKSKAVETKETKDTAVETPVTEEQGVMNEAEKEAVKEQENKVEETGANTERLQLATNLVSSKFNLDDSYRVAKFDDKGKVVNLTLENGEFIVAVTIKDSDRHGMIVD